GPNPCPGRWRQAGLAEGLRTGNARLQARAGAAGSISRPASGAGNPPGEVRSDPNRVGEVRGSADRALYLRGERRLRGPSRLLFAEARGGPLDREEGGSHSLICQTQGTPSPSRRTWAGATHHARAWRS